MRGDSLSAQDRVGRDDVHLIRLNPQVVRGFVERQRMGNDSCAAALPDASADVFTADRRGADAGGRRLDFAALVRVTRRRARSEVGRATCDRQHLGWRPSVFDGLQLW